MQIIIEDSPMKVVTVISHLGGKYALIFFYVKVQEQNDDLWWAFSKFSIHNIFPIIMIK